MRTQRRRWYQRLSIGWTRGRGPWIQESGREHGSRSSGWLGGRIYLRRTQNRR
jgi:hypothetical protein